MLMIASGQTAVVKYLLEQGARCEANTFDGERCLYALVVLSLGLADDIVDAKLCGTHASDSYATQGV